jgi:hypothetical protein
MDAEQILPDSVRSRGMVAIDAEGGDTAGLLFRYECNGSEFRVRILKEPPAGFDQGDTLPTKFIEKWCRRLSKVEWRRNGNL